VHFLNWLLEQQEEPGDVGLFATVIWQDINNGCGLRYTEYREWQHHFIKKHPRMAKRLIALLESSYLLYMAQFTVSQPE